MLLLQKIVLVNQGSTFGETLICANIYTIGRQYRRPKLKSPILQPGPPQLHHVRVPKEAASLL
ncbi:hypothetical protein FRX31_026114 [Thalictrum thalictroides]|uniref:Uncharacterized protein n=1 Tax=Thalictrum thalictroides TaxID=46969 RepID=A0A7J6VGS2_THATH|nr:hypothetical protein FRX31_026114 [Thalictrum thalictroides]